MILGCFVERLDGSLTQKMFRSTWLGDSEGLFHPGPICYEFLIILFRHTFLGRREAIDYHPGNTEGPPLGMITIKVSMNSIFYAP